MNFISGFRLFTEKVEEKDPEISKNAQFRAIIPSSSILSTVENDVWSYMNLFLHYSDQMRTILMRN